MKKKDNFRQNKKKSLNTAKGRNAEETARKFLINNDIRILEKNYFTRFGEIDLIGLKKNLIIFIEVKYRQNNKYGHGSEVIGWRKKQAIKKAALNYLAENENNFNEIRFDLIEIINNKKIINPEKNMVIKWTKNILQFDDNV